MTIRDYIARLEKLTQTWGYVVWLDQLGNWHANEIYSEQDGMSFCGLCLRQRPFDEVWAVETWVMPAPSRYQALKEAKRNYNRKLLEAK